MTRKEKLQMMEAQVKDLAIEAIKIDELDAARELTTVASMFHSEVFTSMALKAKIWLN